LIHHQNKDKEAKGIDKVSGSARIVAAVWGIWQIVAKDPNNEQDTIRWLKVKPREGEAVTLTLGINPKDTWASAGIFSFLGEFGDESGVKRTQGEKVMELLRKFSPKGLEYQELDNFLGIGKSLYTVLDHLEDRQMICKRRSHFDQRRWVYCLPEHTTDDVCTTKTEEVDMGYSPPPPLFPSGVEQMAKSLDIIEVKDSQQLFSTESTTVQQSDSVEHSKNGHKPHQTGNTAHDKISQQLPEKKGEREVVKPSTPNGVLQNPKQGSVGKGGKKGEIIYTIPYSSFPNPLFRCEEEVLKIGDKVRDIINGFNTKSV
jgi:hypothetical protein